MTVFDMGRKLGEAINVMASSFTSVSESTNRLNEELVGFYDRAQVLELKAGTPSVSIDNGEKIETVDELKNAVIVLMRNGCRLRATPVTVTAPTPKKRLRKFRLEDE